MLLASDHRHTLPGLMEDRYSNFILHNCGIGLNLATGKVKTWLYSICSFVLFPGHSQILSHSRGKFVSTTARTDVENLLHNCEIKSESGLGTRLQCMKFEHNFRECAVVVK